MRVVYDPKLVYFNILCDSEILFTATIKLLYCDLHPHEYLLFDPLMVPN